MHTENNPLLTYGQFNSITSSFAIKHAMRNIHIKRNSEQYKSQFSLLLKMIFTYKNETKYHSKTKIKSKQPNTHQFKYQCNQASLLFSHDSFTNTVTAY
jgi:hypothetical protein